MCKIKVITIIDNPKPVKSKSLWEAYLLLNKD